VRTYELLHKVSLVKLVKFVTIMEIPVFLSTTLLPLLWLCPRILLTIFQLILLDEDSSQAFHLPDTWVWISTWWTTAIIFRMFLEYKILRQHLNTFRTGDANLRFYITTAQDAWRKSAFLTLHNTQTLGTVRPVY